MGYTLRSRLAGKKSLLVPVLLFLGCEWPGTPHLSTSVPALDLRLSHDAIMRIRKSAFVNDWVSVRIQGDTKWQDGRMRIHGNVTRHDMQKGYKLEIYGGYPVRAVEANILSPQMSDASFCRYRLARYFFAKTDLLLPSVEVSQMYINDLFEGLHLRIEEVDELFFTRRNLPLSSLYKINIHGRFTTKTGVLAQQSFEKKIPDDDMSFGDLNRLIAILDRGVTPQNATELESILDVYKALDYLAVSILIANGDGIVNNFYLYFNARTDRFEFIPWDLNSTFTMEPTLYPDYSNGLFEQLRSIPRYERYLLSRMREIFDLREAVAQVRQLYAYTIDLQLQNPYLPLIRSTPEQSLKQIETYLIGLDTVLRENAL